MKTKPDRRIEKTRIALLHALVRLMAREGFDGVNVQMICAEADVSRSTFYGHFENKGELLNYGFDRIESDLKVDREGRGLKDFGTMAFLPALFEHVHSHQELYQTNSTSLAGYPVFNRFKQLVEQLGRAELDRSPLGKKLASDQRAFLTGGIFSVLEDWHSNGCKTPTKRVLSRLDAMISTSLAQSKSP